jgi:hypothetical protein
MTIAEFEAFDELQAIYMGIEAITLFTEGNVTYSTPVF